MVNSFAVYTMWKNKAQTSDTLPINNSNNKVAQFDIDLSQPISAIDFLFSGRLTVAGGGVDPSATLDATLRMFTMSCWIESDNGNIDIIQPQTPLYMVYRMMQKITDALKSACTPGGFAISAVNSATPFPYLAVDGLTASANQDYAFHMPLYFGFLSSLANEYQAGLLMPNPSFRSMKVQFNNVVAGGGQVVTGRGYPFPNSNNTYSFTGFGGVGVSQVQAFIAQVDPTKVDNTVAGKVVPIIRKMTLQPGLGIVGGSGVQNQMTIDKWDRGILWQGTGIFEDRVTPATGATTNGAQIPASSLGGATCTVLRDVTLFANSQRLSEWNNLLEVLRQNTQSSQFGAVGGYTKIDASPSLLLYTKNGQFSTLGDLRRFFAENDTVIYQFDNVQDPGAGITVWVDVMNYGYQAVPGVK